MGSVADEPVESLLAELTKLGIQRPPLEYEKAHTYPASQPFFEPLEPDTAFQELPLLDGPFWAYVHIPFCNYSCSFCFYKTVLSNRIPRVFPDFLDGIRLELEFLRKMRDGDRFQIRDLYIGGGTPTALCEGQLTQVLEVVLRGIVPSSDFLGTCECSPESITRQKALLLMGHGIQRISVGVQSLSQGTLDAVGRLHRVEDVLRAYELLRASGCSHINVDLIYGFPGQTPAQWESEVESALSMRPESFTMYYLRYVPGTPLASLATAPDRVAWGDMVRMRQIYFELLFDAGYEMCRPHVFRLPREDVRRYRGAPTFDHGNNGRQFGLGPSAYSHIGGRVSRSGWPVSRWLRRVHDVGFGTVEGRALTRADRLARAAVQALVGDLGLDRDRFFDETGYGLEATYAPLLLDLSGSGLLQEVPTGYRLTPRGVLVDEEISYLFYPERFRQGPGSQ